MPGGGGPSEGSVSHVGKEAVAVSSSAGTTGYPFRCRVENHSPYCSKSSRNNLSARQRGERGQSDLLENGLIRGREREQANNLRKGVVEIADGNHERAQGKRARGISQARDGGLQRDACR